MFPAALPGIQNWNQPSMAIKCEPTVKQSVLPHTRLSQPATQRVVPTRVNLQEAAGKSQSRGRHAWKHAWNNKILKQNLYSCLLEVKVWMGGIGYKVATGGCLWQWIYPGFDVEVLHYDSAKSCRYRKLGKRYMSPLCVISHNCKWIINYLPLKTSGLGREPAQSVLSTQTGGPVFDPQSIQIKPQACCAGQPA